MIYISREGKIKLEEKLRSIEMEVLETYRLMGESTKIDNDLRENPEYNELQNKVSYKLPYEKSQVKELLNNSLIIEDQDFYKNFDGKTVIIGSKITLLYNNVEEVYSIVGQGEEDPFNNIISYSCDFANSIIGKKINDEFRYRNSNVKILKVELL